MNLYMNAAILALMASEAYAAVVAPNSCQDFLNALTAGVRADIRSTHHRLNSVHVDTTCVNNLIAHAGTEDAVIRLFKDYPNILARAADNKSYAVTRLSNKVFSSLPENVVSRFFKKSLELQCYNLETHAFANLNHMMKKKKLAKLITPACFEGIPRLHTHANVKNVKNLDDKIFATLETPIHEDYFQEMTADQIKNFQSNRDLVEDACSAPWVRLDMIKEKLWESVSPRCAQNWILNHSATHKLSSKHINKVKASQLDKSDPNLFAALAVAFLDDRSGKSAWRKADISLVQCFAEADKAAYLMPEGVKPGLKVTAQAFFDMEAPVQGMVLAKVEELPDDLFSQMGLADIDLITYADDKGKKECTGVKCLKLLRGKKNLAKIMEHVVSVVVAEKPELEYYANKDHKIIGEHMSRSAFKELDIDVEQLRDHIKDLPENMLQFISTDDLKELFDHKDGSAWRDLAQDYVDDKKKSRIWPGILKNPKVCARLIRMYTFDKLAKTELLGAMDAFDSACLRVFPEFSKLPENYLRAIGDKLYEAFTKADANLIDHSKSTPTQIGNASSRVENVADHYAASFDAESIKKVAVDVWPFMNAGWFEAMSEETYGGISEEQFAGAQAERLTRVSAGQFSHLNDKVKKSLTPEQITLIGFHSGPNSNEERAMLAALGAVSGSFNEHQAKAFKARAALTESGAMGAASASLMALVASLAIIFPLL